MSLGAGHGVRLLEGLVRKCWFLPQDNLFVVSPKDGLVSPLNQDFAA